MSALRQTQLPAYLRNEIARLKGAGFPLLPLGGGDDGKAPLLRQWADPGVTLGQILAPMHRSGSQVYGLRLDGLAVIDCDSDDPDLVAQMEKRFGSSPVHVKTPRGRHLYYRVGAAVPNLRGEGLPVDIKTGARSYVVGPLSVRPDGGFYAPAKGVLGIDALPPLRATTTPSAGVAPVLTGHRHVALVEAAMHMVESVDSADELQANLAGVRDHWCEDAASMPDAELRDIAAWAWKCRLENRIYRGRDSAFPVHRLALDALRGFPNSADAIALYVTLVDQHGHKPGKRFALDFDAMRAAGILPLSKIRLRAARCALQDTGLLRLVGKHKVGTRPQQFVLVRVNPNLADARNVASMPNRLTDSPARKQGGGSKLTFDGRIRHNNAKGHLND